MTHYRVEVELTCPSDWTRMDAAIAAVVSG
jgi:hypothetical protein